MLAFDIETLGKLTEEPLPAITCVCLYDGKGISHRLRFLLVSDAEFDENKQIMLKCLDSANRLAGFNAVHFDLAYIQRFFQVDQARMNAWILKCVDPFMVAKYILKTTCGLNHLLALNGLGSKTGNGSDAIALALDQKWDMLLDYCLMDARLTHELCSLPSIAFSPFLRASNLEAGLWRFSLKPPPHTATVSLVALELTSVEPFYLHAGDEEAGVFF